MARKHSNKRRHRGGAGAPNPSSYSSAATYGEAVNGSVDSQLTRAFANNQGNTSVGVQGQRAGSKRRHGGSRRKRGGFWGQVFSEALAPFTILGLQQTYRSKKGGKRTRKH